MIGISKDLFKKIRRIQLVSLQLANDILAGAYHSAFKGKGMEFEDVREYEAGDDVRSIDWNVTARMNRPFVKNFREERELTVVLVVDISSSCRFGSRDLLKSDLIAEIAGVLAFSAIKNNDKVGLILFSDTVEKYLPPRKGTRNILRIIRELLLFQPKNHGSDINSALAFLGNVQRRAGICFLISDFICPDYSHQIKLIAKKHDLISICVSDPHEESFPEIHLAKFADLETGKITIVDTSSDVVRMQLKRLSDERFLNLQKIMQKIGAGHIHIRTNQSYLEALRKFFQLREMRRR